jgi:hypothetical protein
MLELQIAAAKQKSEGLNKAMGMLHKYLESGSKAMQAKKEAQGQQAPTAAQTGGGEPAPATNPQE